MGRLHLIIGPPGCGKTHLLLSEIAAEVARAPLGPPAAPPLVLLVPEQQAAQMERAVLEALLTHGVGANSRVQVLSFRWLARKLELAAGHARGELSDSGRRLLVWKLLGEIDPAQFANDAVRNETATLLSTLLGELARCAATAEELQQRAHALAISNPQLAQKAALLAEVAWRFAAHCEREGLHFTSPPTRIPQLLCEQHWPMLTDTQVWVDGFSTFTAAEELALIALLKQCAAVTASLLLDPARKDGPAAADVYDWYAPTRKQYTRWGELAAEAGVQFDYAQHVTELTRPRRWQRDAPLEFLARDGLQAAASVPATAVGVTAVVCSDERAETKAAAREIRRLVLPPELGGAGLRYGQISIAVRSLAPYSGLLQLALTEQAIPYFIDERRSIAHHPACELLRCGLRLAAGCAERDDVYALLKCDLLGLNAEHPTNELWRRADMLENYGRATALRPAAWLAEEPWTRWPEDNDADHSAEVIQLDNWRREYFAPVIALRTALAGSELATVHEVLDQAWTCLITSQVAQRLERWAAAAEASTQADKAELHRRVLQPIAGLFDELVTLAGEQRIAPDSMSPAELCRWLENGLSTLSLGLPPPRLDSVLITDIARGRHHEVAATLLLGLADDSWPPPARQSAYFSDAERALLNDHRPVLNVGSAEDSRAEPYQALVACTRPTQYLWLSRPAADSEGRGRPASPFYSGVLAALGLAEQPREFTDNLAAATTADDVVIAAALAPQDATLQSAVIGVAEAAPDALRGLHWARGRGVIPPLTMEITAQLLRTQAGPPEVDLRQLEALGSCPFRHFTQWLLKLERREAGQPTPSLPRFYRQLLSRCVQLLRDSGYDWSARPIEPIREVASRALAELSEQLAAHGEGGCHIAQRASWLLDRLTAELAELPAGRTPLLLNARFGSGERLDPITINSPLGQVRIRGRVDRVDTTGGAVTVVDLRLRAGSDAINWQRFAAGSELALPAALLATRGHRLWDVASNGTLELMPASAEVQRVEPQWDGDAASFAAAPLRRTFASESANAKLNSLLENTLAETERILASLAERMLAGEVAPVPLRCGRWTACTGCAMRPICRFDPAVGDEYREQHGSDAELRDRVAAGTHTTEASEVAQ